jgi:hypothetical protein
MDLWLVKFKTTKHIFVKTDVLLTAAMMLKEKRRLFPQGWDFLNPCQAEN